MTRASGQSALLKAVIAAVKLAAAEEVMPRYLKVAHQHKGDGSLCTEADLAAQEVLTRKLQGIHNLPVIGEEMASSEQAAHWAAGSDGVWCIDPIDGTSNFVRGLPYFALSVALFRNGESVLGVVYDPVSKEIFAAERGRGAYLNGVRMVAPAARVPLQQAMASVDTKRLPGRLLQQLVLAPPYCSQRNFGASALDWCYLAAGRFDLYLHGSQKLWDYAAGALLLKEAGGLACTLEQDDFDAADIWQRSVVAAADPGLFAAWKDWLRAHA